VLTGFRGRRQRPGRASPKPAKSPSAARPRVSSDRARAPKKGERKIKPMRAAARTARPKPSRKQRRR
jgi:hypothetical protein